MKDDDGTYAQSYRVTLFVTPESDTSEMFSVPITIIMAVEPPMSLIFPLLEVKISKRDAPLILILLAPVLMT